MFLNKEILEKISKNLSLPYTGIEQDWDLEMANSKRINEFLNYYKQHALSQDEKFAIMSLILASYNDFLEENNVEVDSRWKMIREILESDRSSFADLLNYWSSDGEIKKDNVFRITMLIREIA
jgi:hypothetical protein